MRIALFLRVSVFVAALILAPGTTAASAQAPALSVGPVARLVSPTLAVADSLFFAMEPDSALLRLEVRLEVAPDDFEARWQAARAALVLGTIREGGDESKGQMLRRATYHAEYALALRPDDPEALSWAAATKGRLAIDDSGVRAQAQLAHEVWELSNRLLAIDPNHPLGNDVIGKLHQEITKLSGFERFLARTILGGGAALKEASWERSEEHLLRAIEADPTVVLFYLDLGETYLAQGKVELAIPVLEAGLALPDMYPPDPKFKRTLRRRLREARSR